MLQCGMIKPLFSLCFVGLIVLIALIVPIVLIVLIVLIVPIAPGHADRADRADRARAMQFCVARVFFLMLGVSIETTKQGSKLMHLYTEAKHIVTEALEQSDGDFDTARDYLHETCDNHEIAIYYGKAIEFCATHDTNGGEQWLEDCDLLIQSGDTFGGIACRIAFATLLCECERVLADLESDVA